MTDVETRPDGTFVGTDNFGLIWISKDGGLTWEAPDPRELIARAA